MLPSIVVACCCACSQEPNEGLDEREHVYTIAGGEFVELLVELEAATALATDWSASAPLPWEVHAHPFGMLEVYEQGMDASGMIVFTAPASRRFGVQWANFGDAIVTLDVTIALPADAILIEW